MAAELQQASLLLVKLKRELLEPVGGELLFFA